MSKRNATIENAEIENVETLNNEVINAENETLEGTQADETTEQSNGSGNGSADETTENEKSAIELKAEKVLRMKMPNLGECALNLEKRTGSFYKSMLITQLDDNGNQVIGTDGQPVKKLSRLVVSLHEINEDGTNKIDEDGNLIPTAEAIRCADEIVLKKAAATISMNAFVISKFADRRKAIEAQLQNLTEEETAQGITYLNAVETIEEFDIPETATVRVSTNVVLTETKQKLEDAHAANLRLRNMLIAAGIDPDALA